jgi:GINS complex subunit 1
MRRDFAVMCGLTVHFESCKRNKRCLIAYLQHRLYKIRALRWETGRVVPENLRHTISRREHDYYDGYDTLLVDYMKSVGDNLTADMKPPKELFLQVRALVDCGEVATESGYVTLGRNTTHYLRRSDVEHLIKQGMLEQIEE